MLRKVAQACRRHGIVQSREQSTLLGIVGGSARIFGFAQHVSKEYTAMPLAARG